MVSARTSKRARKPEGFVPIGVGLDLTGRGRAGVEAGAAGELYPRVGFTVTNMTRPAERVVTFCNQRGTAEQWINEGKNAVTWTRISCRSFKAVEDQRLTRPLPAIGR